MKRNPDFWLKTRARYRTATFICIPITYETEANGEARSVYFLLGVAILVLLSAFVNYVNLTTSKALDRAREIGVRKAVGSTQGQIRAQILVEIVLVNMLAGGVAVGLVVVLRPVLVDVAGLPEGFSVLGDAFFWNSTAAFLVLISIGGKTIATALLNPVKSLRSE